MERGKKFFQFFAKDNCSCLTLFTLASKKRVKSRQSDSHHSYKIVFTKYWGGAMRRERVPGISPTKCKEKGLRHNNAFHFSSLN